MKEALKTIAIGSLVGLFGMSVIIFMVTFTAYILGAS